MLIMNTEFKTLDAPVHDYYYKHEDNYVDQYDDALYPATSLPPQTEIITVPQTEQTSEEVGEYELYDAEGYAELEEYSVYDGGDGYYTDHASSGGSSFLGLGLIFVILLLIAAIATIIALVVNDNKKKKKQQNMNNRGYQYPNNQQNYNGYNQNQQYPNNQQGYQGYNQNQPYSNGQNNPNNNRNYPQQ